MLYIDYNSTFKNNPSSIILSEESEITLSNTKIKNMYSDTSLIILREHSLINLFNSTISNCIIDNQKEPIDGGTIFSINSIILIAGSNFSNISSGNGAVIYVVGD